MKSLFLISDRYHGRGKVIFAWNAGGTYLCTSGINGLVHIFDRQGNQVVEVQLESKAQTLAIDWDKDGESVAILQSGVDRVAIWELASRSVLYVDSGLKEPTWLKWSGASPQLAIASSKGGLVLYRADSRRKLPITGKHSKAIICGDWSRDGKLALGGADNMLTISSPEGDTLEQSELKYTPQGVQFATQKAEARPKGDTAETTVSVNMGGRTILLYSLREGEQPIELAFQARYGRIVKYKWFGDGYLMLGFSEGFVAVISTHLKEIGEELFSSKVMPAGIDDLACSVTAQRAAVAGGTSIRFLDLNGWKEVKGEACGVDPAHGSIGAVQWTADGAIVTASTTYGHLYAFLARVPTLLDSCAGRLAYMSSLREVSIVDMTDAGPAFTSNALPLLATVAVAAEPGLLALGPRHVGIAMNNRAWYYRYEIPGSGGGPSVGQAVCEKDYSGSADAIRCGAAHAAVLVGGRIFIHPLESSSREMKRVPERDDGPAVTCLAIEGEYLTYGTAAGTVEMYSLRDSMMLPTSQLRLDGSVAPMVRGVYPKPVGNRVLILDSTGRVLLGNPVDSTLMLVPDVPEGVTAALWDNAPAQSSAGKMGARGSCFALVSDSSVASFVYSPVTLTGPSITRLGKLDVQANGDLSVELCSTPWPSGATPACFVDGVVVAAYSSSTASSPLLPVLLETHNALHRAGRVTPDRAKQAFAQRVALMRLQAAWESAVGLDDQACWLALAGKAMESLELELAERCYRYLKDAGMVQSLRSIGRVEDRRAAAGHVAVLFGDYTLAQELFLGSTQARAALDMHRDLLQWETALKLAETLAPEQVPGLAVELARECEGKGDSAAALLSYGRAKERLEALAAASTGSGLEVAEEERVRRSSCAGIARITLKQGDVRRGLSLALDSGDRALCRECAGILEGMKQFNEAAVLYKAAAMWDKAASLYIAAKNFSALSSSGLMDMVSTPKLHGAYAKAKEAGREYGDALKAYEKARDIGAQVRLLMEHLGAPERAGELVRSTRHSEGAALLAKFCKSRGDVRGAIEFLLLAKKGEEAFEMAGADGPEAMALYVHALRRALYGGPEDGASGRGVGGRRGVGAASPRKAEGTGPLTEEEVGRVVLPPLQCERIGAWYQSHGCPGAAGRLYAECGATGRAMACYLAGGEGEIGAAVALAGKVRDDAVTGQLLEWLLGGVDGVPKDPLHVRSLYLAVGNHKAAARTALLIAKQEQDVGNYRAAHAVLFGTVRELDTARLHIPGDLLTSLHLLHSYTLVRRLVRADNHEGGARMALRVARAISRFPAHVVPILTSTVIECQRAGLKKSAFEYACALMRPEYRDTVEDKYRKKIEALVRRPSEEEAGEEEAPCPFCSASVPAYDLSCGVCKSRLPLCILTGRHMVAADCSACPSCRFPALYSAMAAMLAAAKAETPIPGSTDAVPVPTPDSTACPMCGETVPPYAVVHMSGKEAGSFLRRAAGEEEGKGGEGAGNSAA